MDIEYNKSLECPERNDENENITNKKLGGFT